MAVRFDQNFCDPNPYRPAVRVCPTGALFVDRKTFRPSYDSEKCSGCGVCVSSCAKGAVSEE